MHFKKEFINNHTVFSFEVNNKNYTIPLKGQGRRIASLEFLLKRHPRKMNIHDAEFARMYDDPNKAMNEFINDEGFSGLVEKESKNNPRTGRKVDYYSLRLSQICNFLDNGGEFGKSKRRQPSSIIKKKLYKDQKGLCNISGLKLFRKKELKSKNINFFITLLTLEYEHRVPLFKGGSDDPDKKDNWQLLSEYANKEKNKICKTCLEDEEGCKQCALAFPESNKVIKPSNQNLKDLGFKPFESF